MPWKESCAMDERARFCHEVMTGDWSVAELCRAYGISRVTGYKWLGRYESGGVAALADQSRARHTQEHAYPEAIRELVIEARKAHPTWGAKKLRGWLVTRGHSPAGLPSLTTMESMLRKADLVRRQRRSRRLKGGLGTRAGDDRPNGVWAVDFKGEFRLGRGPYCYPLTVTDSYSRYVLACDALRSTQFEPSWKVFDRLFTEYGVPERIRSDNGAPFASTGAGRLTQLSVFWMTLGIELHRTRPGHPEDNGRHERMHRTLKEETTRPPAGTFAGQQRRFNRFRREYNEERPHEALGLKCPAELYERSSRPYEEVEPEYPAHWEQRRVSTIGQIRWKHERVFVSKPLAGEMVGLVEIEDGVWKVTYRQLLLGRLITRDGKPRFEAIR